MSRRIRRGCPDEDENMVGHHFYLFNLPSVLFVAFQKKLFQTALDLADKNFSLVFRASDDVTRKIVHAYRVCLPSFVHSRMN